MDRFFSGFTAGVLGGVVMSIMSLTSYTLGFSNIRHIDWAAVMVLGHRPTNLGDIIIALLLHLVWAGFLGFVFAYFIKTVSSKGYLIKGAIFGFIVHLITYTLPTLFKLQELRNITTLSGALQLLGGIVWGIVTALVLAYNTNKVRALQ